MKGIGAKMHTSQGVEADQAPTNSVASSIAWVFVCGFIFQLPAMKGVLAKSVDVRVACRGIMNADTQVTEANNTTIFMIKLCEIRRSFAKSQTCQDHRAAREEKQIKTTALQDNISVLINIITTHSPQVNKLNPTMSAEDETLKQQRKFYSFNKSITGDDTSTAMWSRKGVMAHPIRLTPSLLFNNLSSSSTYLAYARMNEVVISGEISPFALVFPFPFPYPFPHTHSHTHTPIL